jgi:hypothetical protein
MTFATADSRAGRRPRRELPLPWLAWLITRVLKLLRRLDRVSTQRAERLPETQTRALRRAGAGAVEAAQPSFAAGFRAAASRAGRTHV